MSYLELGDMPVDRVPPAGWHGEFGWEPGADWPVVDVAAEGVLPDDESTDAAATVMELVARLPGPRVLAFPAGTFRFGRPCVLRRGGVVIRGAGAEQTRFLLDGPDGARVEFAGAPAGDPVPLRAPFPERGDLCVHVDSSADLAPGAVAKLFQDVPFAEQLSGDLPPGCWGQILDVQRISGDAVTGEMPFGQSYLEAGAPRLQRLDAVREVGIEKVTLQKARDDGQPSLVFSYVRSGMARDLMSKRASRAHIVVRESRGVTIRDCVCERSLNLTDASSGRGIVLTDCATRCYVVGNRSGNMRHAFVLERGTNHCVVAYNYAYAMADRRRACPDECRLNGGWANNNLLEGNVGHIWYPTETYGPNGPHNTWFRNRCYFSSYQYGTHWTVVANVFTKPNQGTPGARDDFAGANLSGSGRVFEGYLAEHAELPPSLFLTGKPAWFGDLPWPPFGPENGDDWGRGNRIPAMG